MKLKHFIAVGLILAGLYLIIGVLTRFREDSITHIEEVERWRDAYDQLLIKHESLSMHYDSLVLLHARTDSNFRILLKRNTEEYEKIIAGYDTLSIDEHIVLLSKYLSEKDSL